MTSRNLTEVFVIMRNNASKNRNHYDDRVSLHMLFHMLQRKTIKDKQIMTQFTTYQMQL